MNRLLADWDAAQAQLERRRWTLSTLAVVLGCSALVAAAHWRPAAATDPLPPAAAMVVELAPLPQTPSAPSAQPPGPQQVEAPKPRPKTPQPQPRIEAPVTSDIALPQAEPQQEEQPRQEHPPAPATTAPPSEDAPAADLAAAPRQSAQSMSTAAAKLSFQQQLLGHLQRHKRYPAVSQMRRQQGVPYIRFRMDRKGTVLSASLERSGGHAPLDQEALALLQRAQPLPALPDDIAGDTAEFVVPVEFFLKQR